MSNNDFKSRLVEALYMIGFALVWMVAYIIVLYAFMVG